MVTRLLHECGLYLGNPEDLMPPEEEDNREGYWEHRKIVDINNAILDVFGGNWNNPPVLPDDWTAHPRLAPIREQALTLVAELSAHGAWGWKDPRTCLTFEFWRELIPDISVVLCVRHPVEVAQSLTARHHDYATREKALRLWHDYNAAALEVVGGKPQVTTHYISYFYDPERELTRMLEAVGRPVDPEKIQTAVKTVDRDLWRGIRLNDEDLARQAPADVRRLFERLREMGGPVLAALRDDEEFQEELMKIALEKSLRRIERLEELTLQRAEEIARLQSLLSGFLHFKRMISPGVPASERLAESKWILERFRKRLSMALRRGAQAGAAETAEDPLRATSENKASMR